jgi:hypothetical protein
MACIPQFDNSVVTIDSSGIMTVNFVAKSLNMDTITPEASQIWIEVTVRHLKNSTLASGSSGNVNFDIGTGTTVTMTLNISDSVGDEKYYDVNICGIK